MLNLKTTALVAASALALSIAQPKPAEAGDAGKIIAGIAIGALAVGILSHGARAHEPRQVVHAPQPYGYAPAYPPYPPEVTGAPYHYESYYYEAPPAHHGPRHHGTKVRRKVVMESTQWYGGHQPSARHWGGGSGWSGGPGWGGY